MSITDNEYDFGSDLISTVGDMFASNAAAGAGSDAAAASERVGLAQIAQNEEHYQQGREDTAPWRQAGEAALSGLAGGVSDLSDYSFEMDSSKVGESDAYKWRREQGNRAADRAMIAAGNSVSGKRIQGMMDIGGRMASQEYEAEFARQHKTSMTNYGFRADHLNRLSSVAGLGQSANSVTAGLAGSAMGANATSAGNVMGAIQQGGAYRAAGIQGMANTGTNFISDQAYSGNEF